MQGRGKCAYQLSCQINVTEHFEVGKGSVINDHAEANNLEGYCMLIAHGGTRFRKPPTLSTLLGFEKNDIFEIVLEVAF